MAKWLKLSSKYGHVHVNIDNVAHMRRDKDDVFTILTFIGGGQTLDVKETPEIIHKRKSI